MRILLTGATGYIGKRLLPALLAEEHEVICCVRDRNRFTPPNDEGSKRIEVLECDFLQRESISGFPQNINTAFYLMHSMSSSVDYSQLERQAAANFREAAVMAGVKQVIYLSGIVNETALSTHLLSRKSVEEELGKGSYALTTLRAGIIIGSGSASFEIIRDLVEKLPVMVAPKWLKTRCQPIAIDDVITCLLRCINRKETFGRNFDIGGPDILSYKDMLLGYAKVRQLKRLIITVPVMTPRLSSYWLYFVTATSFKLARALVDSMKVEVVCRDNELMEILSVTPLNYEQALSKTLLSMEGKQIISSWKDSLISGRFEQNISHFMEVPTYGCLIDSRSKKINNHQMCIDRIWRIGGETGWYYGNSLWRLRGFLDKIFGGVGLRRGRTNPDSLAVGDTVDFWRVLYCNRKEGRLLLFAEMKLPGEAWLEFRISEGMLFQTATFRPKGLLGRLYWYAVLPFHGYVFQGLLDKLTE